MKLLTEVLLAKAELCPAFALLRFSLLLTGLVEIWTWGPSYEFIWPILFLEKLEADPETYSKSYVAFTGPLLTGLPAPLKSILRWDLVPCDVLGTCLDA